jgi:hypothetical protein
MAELIPVPETGELIYEYEGEYYPVSVAEDGQYVVSDGVQMYALDPGEVQSTLDAMQWAAELDENVQVLEHRIGRELTSTEREEVVADASKNGHVDVFDSYYTAHPEADRKATEKGRVELGAEIVQQNMDAQAEEDAKEKEWAEINPDPLAGADITINEKLAAAAAESLEQSEFEGDEDE